MAQFQWQERYDIGVEQMNNHHKRLLSLMDRLETMWINKEDVAGMQDVLKELENFTIYHFAEEEKYMEGIQFPDITVHKVIHQNLLKKLSEHKESFLKTQTFEKNFFEFLKTWLASHICGIDIKYAQHSKSHQKAS